MQVRLSLLPLTRLGAWLALPLLVRQTSAPGPRAWTWPKQSVSRT